MGIKYLATPFKEEQLAERIGRLRHVALDMDGTIYMGSTLFPYTIGFLEQLTEMGIGYSFLTNNPSRNVGDYLKRLSGMGIPATEQKMYTTSVATINFLRINHPDIKRLFILGTPSMTREFEEAGFISTADSAEDEPDAVVVGFDMTLSYERLCRAAWWISQGKYYLATNPDRVCPTDQPNVLVDCGSICAAIEHAVNRNPDVVIGKPNPEFLQGLAERFDVRPDEMAVIGDRLYTDVAVALNAGAMGVLVLSGETTLEQSQKASPRPHLTVGDISDFGLLLKEYK
ncbi:MAG: HAD-IIA family hydrolase [Tidjanibacter sp.]|nr:HAD-IIA family hydrolase [Tidjanibacter sp.]